ncbi:MULTISPECIES: hypothetical protein [unclassified Clostridium]|uniref:hypothetical protein n=1 Tax=unclassified Clostridium TaxID=2614128 RepID=UPI003216512F
MDNTNIKDYVNLYMGLGYEQQAIGQFWKMGFEAMKLNADLGFDILIHNLRTRIRNRNEDMKNYYFQVKSRQCREFDFGFIQTNEGEVQVKSVYLDIEDKYLKLLLDEPKAYLLCYFYDPKHPIQDSIITSFWLNSSNLNWIINNGKFHWKAKGKTWLTFKIFYNADLRHNLDLLRHGIVDKIGHDESKELLDLINELYVKSHIVNHQFDKKVVLLENNKNEDKVKFYILKEQYFDISKFTDADYYDFDNNPLDIIKRKELDVDDELMQKLQDCVSKDICNEAMGIF